MQFYLDKTNSNFFPAHFFLHGCPHQVEQKLPIKYAAQLQTVETNPAETPVLQSGLKVAGNWDQP